MLPQHAPVVGTDVAPAPFEGDESGVEGVALGAPNDFPGASAAEGAQAVHRVGNFQRVEVGLDRGAARLRQAGQATVAELAAAATQKQSKEGEEALPVADGEELQDVARVEAVDPLAERLEGRVLGQERFGQPAVEEASVEGDHRRGVVGGGRAAFLACAPSTGAEASGALLPQDGTQVNRRLPAGQARWMRSSQRGRGIIAVFYIWTTKWQMRLP